jgi:hypothetical protein
VSAKKCFSGSDSPKKSPYQREFESDINACLPEYLDGDIILMDYALQPRDGAIVAALADGLESTLKTYSRHGDEITLTPIETKRLCLAKIRYWSELAPGGMRVRPAFEGRASVGS